jgi:hypothetical protein
MGLTIIVAMEGVVPSATTAIGEDAIIAKSGEFELDVTGDASATSVACRANFG